MASATRKVTYVVIVVVVVVVVVVDDIDCKCRERLDEDEEREDCKDALAATVLAAVSAVSPHSNQTVRIVQTFLIQYLVMIGQGHYNGHTVTGYW